MPSKAELKKLLKTIEEHTRPPSELSGFFELSWRPPSMKPGERPLWPLACYDLARLVVLLELPGCTIEEQAEISARLAVATKDNQLRELPPNEMILRAVKEEQTEREESGICRGRNGRVDNRPHPQGGPGTCSAGFYHAALDPSVNWDAQEVVPGEHCAVCGNEPLMSIVQVEAERNVHGQSLYNSSQ